MNNNSAFLVYAKEYFRNPELRARLSATVPFRDSSDSVSPLRDKLYGIDKDKHDLKNEFKNLSTKVSSI